MAGRRCLFHLKKVADQPDDRQALVGAGLYVRVVPILPDLVHRLRRDGQHGVCVCVCVCLCVCVCVCVGAIAAVCGGFALGSGTFSERAMCGLKPVTAPTKPVKEIIANASVRGGWWTASTARLDTEARISIDVCGNKCTGGRLQLQR